MYKSNKQKFLTFWNESKGYITSIVNVAIGIWATDKKFVLEVYNGCFIIVDVILNKYLK